jgi:hypothetical protein
MNGLNIVICQTVAGEKVGEVIDFLNVLNEYSCDNSYPIAYCKGNGYVKIFKSAQIFFNWYVYENPYSESLIDITEDEYDDDEIFSQIIEKLMEKLIWKN